MKYCMKINRAVVLLLALLIPVGCHNPAQPTMSAADAAETAPTMSGQPVHVSSPEAAALATMQAQFDLDAGQISFLSVVEGEWPDACLGMRAADEQCAQIVTAGYVVTLEAGGALYIYNVDQALTTVRLVAAPEM